MKKSKNNIIQEWLELHGKPLPKDSFIKTIGCVQCIHPFTEHEKE